GHRYWRRRRRGSPPPPVGPRPREPVAEDACDHVGGAAGHERDDEADVTRGPGWSGRSLRGGRTGKPSGRQHGRGKKPGETAAGEHQLATSLSLASVAARRRARSSTRLVVEGEATAERPVGQPATALRAAPPRVASIHRMLPATFWLFPLS